MNFDEAIKIMRKGAKVKRKANPQFIYYIKDNIIMEQYGEYIMKAELDGLDILQTDWEVVNNNS